MLPGKSSFAVPGLGHHHKSTSPCFDTPPTPFYHLRHGLTAEPVLRALPQLFVCWPQSYPVHLRQNYLGHLDPADSGRIGNTLTDALDELISEGRIAPQLAMKILSNFDRHVTEVLAEKVKANLTFKVGFRVPSESSGWAGTGSSGEAGDGVWGTTWAAGVP